VLRFSVVTFFLSLSLSPSLFTKCPENNLGKTEASVQLALLLLLSPGTSQHPSIYTCKSIMSDIVPRVNQEPPNKPSTTSLLIWLSCGMNMNNPNLVHNVQFHIVTDPIEKQGITNMLALPIDEMRCCTSTHNLNTKKQ
jgi:hypothetical protein